jgi:hypothetical protein
MQKKSLRNFKGDTPGKPSACFGSIPVNKQKALHGGYRQGFIINA